MFTVLGEALVDFVQPAPGGPYVARPGGGPLNIAVGLRRLGHPTELMARLSTRPLGQVGRRYAEANGLALDGCVETDSPATLAFASLDAPGSAAYDFYFEGTSDWGWTDAELARLPEQTLALHTGSLTASVAPGAEGVLRRFEGLRAEGEILLSFDPNVRPDLMGPHPEAVVRVERFVAAAHVVKASDEDLAWLYPGRPVDDVLADWTESDGESAGDPRGPALVVVTRGADGCIARTSAGTESRLPGVAVTVADTIGAGDAFVSGLLSGLADGDRLTPAAVATIDRADLQAALRRATVVAGLTCTRAGADPPTRAEYSAYLESSDLSEAPD